jgi:valyl-tRNA synthetase
VLDQLLRLLHPVIPFVTEELWVALTGRESVVVADWPTPDKTLMDDPAEAEIAALQKVVTEVRRFRSDQGLKPGQRVAAALTGVGAHEDLIRALAKLTDAGAGFQATATLSLTGGVQVALDTRGAIDVAAERARLAKDKAVAEKERTSALAKLGNEAFLAKAPDNVVDKIRTRLAKADEDIARIQAELARETDPKKRFALWEQQTRQFYEKVPVIRYGDLFGLRAMRTTVKGFNDKTERIRFYNVWLEK